MNPVSTSSVLVLRHPRRIARTLHLPPYRPGSSVEASTDLASLDKWDDYTAAKEAMFSTPTPGTLLTVTSNDKKRARLEAMRYVLTQFDYPAMRQLWASLIR